ncbi:hypothetical protein OBJ94_10270 [Empedobacter falsenii]
MSDIIITNDSEFENESFNFDDLQSNLESQLEEQLSDLSDIELDFDKIGDPNALGDTISTVVWEQFINQIGIENGMNAHIEIANTDFAQNTMDNARNGSGDFVDRIIIEKTIKKNDNISYPDARKKTNLDPNFINFKQLKKVERFNSNSKILDEYTGNIISGSEKHEVDHVIAVRNIYDDKARIFSGIETQDLANLTENFAVTNQNLNKSKGKKSNEEYIEFVKRNKDNWERELGQKITQIEDSDAYELDKKHRIAWEKLKVKNKVEAKEDLMLSKQNIAEDKINETIKEKIKTTTEGKILKVKEEGKIIAKSSLKAALMALLASLVKKIIQKLIQWIASGKKNFKAFIQNLKDSIYEFIGELKQHLINAADGLLTSIATAIFGPIINTIKKTWIFLKQGYKSVKEAVAYIKNPQNKGKSLSILMLEVGKIVTAGLTAGGAILLGNSIEAALMTIPGLGFPIPLLGSLASILGIFFGAITSGIIGALALNLIDRMIANKKKSLLTQAKIEKGQEILNTQGVLKEVLLNNLGEAKNQFTNSVQNRHSDLKNSFDRFSDAQNSIDITRTKNDDEIDDLFNLLNS